MKNWFLAIFEIAKNGIWPQNFFSWNCIFVQFKAFSPVEILIFGHFWNCKKWNLATKFSVKLIYLISRDILVWTFFNLLVFINLYIVQGRRNRGCLCTRRFQGRQSKKIPKIDNIIFLLYQKICAPAVQNSFLRPWELDMLKIFFFVKIKKIRET